MAYATFLIPTRFKYGIGRKEKEEEEQHLQRPSSVWSSRYTRAQYSNHHKP
jgi:hypothetical protein